jgi:splicing factor 3A subunit 3
MASTLLEQARQCHEDIERAERLVAKDLKRSMTRYKDRLQQDHRVHRFVEDIQEKSRKLVRFWWKSVHTRLPGQHSTLICISHTHLQIKLYEDDEGVRRQEIEKLGGNNQFSSFYERLKEIKEYYRRNPTNELTEAPDDEAAINSQVCMLLRMQRWQKSGSGALQQFSSLDAGAAAILW